MAEEEKLELELELEYETDPQLISQRTQTIIQDFSKLQQQIEALALDTVTFQNSVQFFSEAEAKFQKWLWTCELMAKVGPSSEVRKSSNESITQMKKFLTETWVKQKLFAVFSQCFEQLKNSGADPEDERILGMYLQLFIRNGASLDPEKKKQFENYSKEISDLCTKFLSNVNEDTSFVELSEAELDGMTEDYKSSLKKSDSGKFIVTMKYPDVFPLMRQCKVEESRKKVSHCFDSRCVNENSALLENIVKLRSKLSELLGFKTYADYILDAKMAKNPQNVQEFTQNLITKLTPLGEKELQALLDLKKQEKADSFDGKFYSWDFQYYMYMLQKMKYAFDEEKAREYFPIHIVMEKIFEIYQSILGLKFTKKEPSKKWHEDVLCYNVHDIQTKEFIGVFYLDIFPRAGKYSHACAYPVVDGIISQKQHAIATMVANFSKPTQTKPSLLTHSEVITFFHEFGHIMHNLCAKAKHSRTTWFNVEMDFLEAPSQMLENWCWQKDILKSISGHYLNLSTPLPDNLIDSIVQSKNLCIGLRLLRQIFLGEFDMKIHSNPSLLDSSPISQIFNELKLKIALIPPTEGTNGAAAFMHMCAGYDVGYYGYLWSEVFSCDMFSMFEKEGVLNFDTGRKYRKFILEPGAKKTGMEMLESFLGRKPTIEPFLKQIGII